MELEQSWLKRLLVCFLFCAKTETKIFRELCYAPVCVTFYAIFFYVLTIIFLTLFTEKKPGVQVACNGRNFRFFKTLQRLPCPLFLRNRPFPNYL